jgi:hypothetical protein
VQAGLNQAVANVYKKGQLTCKDSLLVGWGGATDVYDTSCGIIYAINQGTSVELHGCTLQYHPNSKHLLPTYLMVIALSAHASLSQCLLVGPAPEHAASSTAAATVAPEATLRLVCTRQGWVQHTLVHIKGASMLPKCLTRKHADSLACRTRLLLIITGAQCITS